MRRKIGECVVNLHQILDVQIANCFPLRNGKREQTGTILFVVCVQENLHNSTGNRSEMGVNRTLMESSMHMQSQLSQMSHLGRIDKSCDFQGPDQYDEENEKLQLQMIRQELKEQNQSNLLRLFCSI